MIGLKPCPFCGSTDLFVYGLVDGIRCENCGVKFVDFPDWEDRWNRRVNE